MKIYKVFEINKCFDEYASDVVLVGAESVIDIFTHWKEIFPDDRYIIHREDWMEDEDWNELCENGKYKEGDIKVDTCFTKKEMKAFKESLDPDNEYPRIKEVPHLYTDTPYEFLTGFSYME